MRARSTAVLLVLALLGLVLAAGITLAASSLTSQRVGLSAEPLSAGEELVPQTTVEGDPTGRRPRTTPARTSTTPATTTPTVTTDDSGGGDDRGRSGHGGDD